MQDFAGSTVVHYQGALAGLAGAILLGPRIGKYGPDRKPNAIPGHNMAYVTLGVIILWFGWFGFNPGSTLERRDFGGVGFFAYVAHEHEHRGGGRRPRRRRHLVARDQEARPLDDAQRRHRGARRDHRRRARSSRRGRRSSSASSPA